MNMNDFTITPSERHQCKIQLSTVVHIIMMHAYGSSLYCGHHWDNPSVMIKGALLISEYLD